MSGEGTAGLRWRRRLKYRLEYAGLRFVGLVCRALPMETSSAFMGWCWRTVAPRLHRHERALAHLRLAFPAMTEAEREAIALDMWSNLGRVFAEAFFIDRILKSGRVEDRTVALLTRLKAEGGGIVFVSLHAGNWELAVAPTAAAGIKAAGVYQKVKNPYVDAYLAARRRDSYPRGLFQKGGETGRKLMRIVREHGAVAILADLRDRAGIAVPFFGHPAPSTPFPALICRSVGADLIAGRVVRTGGVRFVIEAVPVEVPRTANREADIAEATRRIQALFEQWIRENPAQWMWGHKRWG